MTRLLISVYTTFISFHHVPDFVDVFPIDESEGLHSQQLAKNHFGIHLHLPASHADDHPLGKPHHPQTQPFEVEEVLKAVDVRLERVQKEVVTLDEGLSKAQSLEQIWREVVDQPISVKGGAIEVLFKREAKDICMREKGPEW